MIGKAKAISHGINALRYIKGESRNKKEPEKIHHVCDQYLSPELDAMGIWLEMSLTANSHPGIRNSVIHIEVSPAMEHTKDFTIEDWQKLWQEFAEEFDRLTIHDSKGKILSPHTNVMGSKATVWLHEESDSGIPHLHALVCRVDEEGNINNDHQIHLRAQRAAEAVAKRRGWTTANQIRTSNIQQVNEDCMEVLRAMPQWSFDDYFQRLIGKGYYVKSQVDKQGVVRGYTLFSKKNLNVRYKASDLGTGRNLTASRIEKTWMKLHQPSVEMSPQQSGTPVHQSPQQPQPSKPQGTNRTLRSTFAKDYTQWKLSRSKVTIDSGGKTFTRYIPDDVMSLLEGEFDSREVANWQPLTNLAMAFFTMLAVPDVTPSGGGGDSSSDQGWGRDKDENEKEWARRCAQAAVKALGRKPKKGMRR